MSDVPIQPNCRYGHGNLVKLDGRLHQQRWGLVAHDNSDVLFVAALYTCPTCGYLEMFDDDVAATLQQQAWGRT